MHPFWRSTKWHAPQSRTGLSRHSVVSLYRKSRFRRFGNVTAYEGSVHAEGTVRSCENSRIFGSEKSQGSLNVKRAIQNSIDTIGQFPERGERAGIREVRVIPVRRYPYLIHWTIEAAEV